MACSDARGLTPLEQSCPSQATLSRHLVEQLEKNLQRHRYQIRVRIDAGFTDNTTLSALEEKDIHYLGRLKGNSRLQKLAQP